MTVFTDWQDLPPSVVAHLIVIEGFVLDVDGKTIAAENADDTFTDEGTIDADEVVKAINGLVEEIRRITSSLETKDGHWQANDR